VIDAGPAGLAGRRIAFRGLEVSITDVLVRVADQRGGYSTTLVRPSQPWIEVPAPRGWWGVAGAYLAHGLEHILFGFDHLLFVLGLMLIVRGRRPLVMTITAFTVAHSITLAAATLGYVRLPGPPLETAIALSILVLAVEIARMQRGEPCLTAGRPWVVAFAFGLLHGLGFAGALAELGLPQSDIPLALFAFNVGVEIGQLVFVAAILGLLWTLRRIRAVWPVWARWAPTYALGTMAAFWFFDRLSGFVA
jgi:hydrogenase/urease accessory protein HupE